MLRISSQHTMVCKIVVFSSCLVMAAVASQVLFLETMGLGVKFVLFMMVLIVTLLLQILSFKISDVFMDRNTILIKGIGSMGYVSISNISALKEIRFLGGLVAVLNFDEKKPFGTGTLFIPSRTMLEDEESAGVDVLKNRLNKENQPGQNDQADTPPRPLRYSKF